MLIKRIRLVLMPIGVFALLAPLAALAGVQLDGNLDASSPTWNRVKDTASTAPAICGTESEDSYNNNVRYAQFHIVPAVNTTLQAAIDPTGSTSDSMLALYCSPFDPADPAANLVAMDDDANGYPHAALTGRAIALLAGQDYYLVVSNYSTYNPDGQFRLVLGNDLAHVHSLSDVIVALQVLAGSKPVPSQLSGLSDIRENNQVTLSAAIRALQDLTGDGEE
ncbi:MAG: hypothetical protein IH612_11440 [Desulfofustis sp.]|nr:hypothetical protein [Desulfofustis sp.]